MLMTFSRVLATPARVEFSIVIISFHDDLSAFGSRQWVVTLTVILAARNDGLVVSDVKSQLPNFSPV